jgi:hypothetical protein
VQNAAQNGSLSVRSVWQLFSRKCFLVLLVHKLILVRWL